MSVSALSFFFFSYPDVSDDSLKPPFVFFYFICINKTKRKGTDTSSCDKVNACYGKNVAVILEKHYCSNTTNNNSAAAAATPPLSVSHHRFTPRSFSLTCSHTDSHN